MVGGANDFVAEAKHLKAVMLPLKVTVIEDAAHSGERAEIVQRRRLTIHLVQKIGHVQIGSSKAGEPQPTLKPTLPKAARKCHKPIF